MAKNMRKTPVKGEEPKTVKKPANLTPEEAAIFQRIKAEGQTREWEEVTEESVHDFRLGRNPMKPPDFALKLTNDKKYVFRWITRSKERIDEVRNFDIPFKWWIVNASTIPESQEALDPVLGCVTKLDQLLVFKPYWMWEKVKRIQQERIEGKDRAGDLASKHGQAIDETGSEFLAGRRYKIGGGDEVQFSEVTPDSDVVEGKAEFRMGDDGLGDLLADEETEE